MYKELYSSLEGDLYEPIEPPPNYGPDVDVLILVIPSNPMSWICLILTLDFRQFSLIYAYIIITYTIHIYIPILFLKKSRDLVTQYNTGMAY